MSHLHIPDGIFPFYLPLLGYIVTGVIIAFVLYRLRSKDISRLVPRLGIVSAFIMVVMSVPLGIIPYHLNLTVLAGIILGPGLGFISVFLVNLLLGFVGHGGITMVGLNSLVVGSEVFIGYYLFRMFSRGIKLPAVSAALTTVLTLALSALIMISFVTASRVDPVMFLENEASEVHIEKGQKNNLPQNAVLPEGVTDGESKLSVTRFAAMMLPVTGLGIALEGLAIFGIVRFLARVRPDILGLEMQQQKRDNDKNEV